MDPLLIYMFCKNGEWKIVLSWFQELAEQFQVRILFKTRTSTKNLSSNFGLIEETMYLSCIFLPILVLFMVKDFS